MSGKDFTPLLPEGFVNAGTFNGVTTAVGPGGADSERIRYQLTGVPFPTSGLLGFGIRQLMKTGVGGEVALGSLHSKLEFAMALIGEQPEAGVTERLDAEKPDGLVLGHYLERTSAARRYAAMSLVKTKEGTLEIFVTRCATEDRARELMRAAMAPYV